MGADERVARTSAIKDLELRETYKELNEKAMCAFDDPYSDRNRPVFTTGTEPKYWWVWYHPKPIKGTRMHIMLASKVHARHLYELEPEAVLELAQLEHQLTARFGDSCALVARLGGSDDANYNAASIYHLSFHFTVSDARQVYFEQVPPEFLQIYRDLKAACPGLEDITDDAEREKARLEFIDDLREWIDVARAIDMGTAWPIRVKISNQIDHSLADGGD